MSPSNKYKEGEFGYWWTVTKVNEDIEGGDYKGDIRVSYANLTSLRGAPRSVRGFFNCGNNKLTSLKHCPTIIQGDFYCYENKLTSLEHCPESVGGDFYCSGNGLTSLEHCSESVGGSFYCYDNRITSLEHCPRVGRGFYCHNNHLKSLKFSPEKIPGDFWCQNNIIINLKHAPREIGSYFECDNNPLVDPLSEVIDNNIVAKEYGIYKKRILTFKEIEDEKRKRAIKRQLGPFAITVSDKKV